jgi:hypothetical protein
MVSKYGGYFILFYSRRPNRAAVTPIGQQKQLGQVKLLVLGKKTVLKLLIVVLCESIVTFSPCNNAGARSTKINDF